MACCIRTPVDSCHCMTWGSSNVAKAFQKLGEAVMFPFLNKSLGINLWFQVVNPQQEFVLCTIYISHSRRDSGLTGLCDWKQHTNSCVYCCKLGCFSPVSNGICFIFYPLHAKVWRAYWGRGLHHCLPRHKISVAALILIAAFSWITGKHHGKADLKKSWLDTFLFILSFGAAHNLTKIRIIIIQHRRHVPIVYIGSTMVHLFDPKFQF